MVQLWNYDLMVQHSIVFIHRLYFLRDIIICVWNSFFWQKLPITSHCHQILYKLSELSLQNTLKQSDSLKNGRFDRHFCHGQNVKILAKYAIGKFNWIQTMFLAHLLNISILAHNRANEKWNQLKIIMYMYNVHSGSEMVVQKITSIIIMKIKWKKKFDDDPE